MMGAIPEPPPPEDPPLELAGIAAVVAVLPDLSVFRS
jgi:hypothetical protein